MRKLLKRIREWIRTELDSIPEILECDNCGQRSVIQRPGHDQSHCFKCGSNDHDHH